MLINDDLQREAPPWYVHLLLNRDFQVYSEKISICVTMTKFIIQGCNGAVCYCDDKDGCNNASKMSDVIWLYTFISTFVIMTNNL